MRAPTPPTARAHREVAAVWKRAGDGLFAESEELLAKAAACYAREREELAKAEEAEETEEAKQHWGEKVTLVKGRAA